MTPMFDETVFDTLRGDLGDEDATEALTTFLADTASKMARLGANDEARGLVRQEAHAIKSSAGTFGFADLSRLARDLETSAASLPSAQLRQSINDLRQAFEATRQFAQSNLLDAGMRIKG